MIKRTWTRFQDQGFSRSKVKRKRKLRKTNIEKKPIFCTTLYRKPMQLSNFDGILDQLRNGIFSDGFHP